MQWSKGCKLDDLIAEFVAETREGLEALDSELVLFEQQPSDPVTLGGIFRLIHTIKGTCGFLGLVRLQSVAHAAENVLDAFRDETLAVTPTAVSVILEAVDLIRALTEELAAAGAEPAGDDTGLIERLERLLRPSSSAVEQDASAGEAVSRDVPERLIDRLGGDATLDAAAETAIGALRADGSHTGIFMSADPDRLQAAIRNSLGALARNGVGAVDFRAALTEAAGGAVTGAEAAKVLTLALEGLCVLGVEARHADQLAALVVIDPDEPVGIDSALPEPGTPPVHPSGRGDAVAAVGEASGPAQTIRVSVDALEHLMTVVSELVLIRNQLIQTLRLEPESPFAAPLNRLNQVTSELQEGVMTTRMQPISGAWAKLPRLVRDLAQDLDKSIDLVMTGQDTELDRQVLELIRDPLTHMIRNAADHGLETPAERLAAGKPETGRIDLQARHEGGAIVIEISDDGRGLAPARLRAKAVAAGVITAAQAEQMSDAEARELIFLPGLSTAAEVTSVSGRGVGMDVVRTNIEKIGGVIELSSVEGRGACFTIRIPLTLTIVSALIVECCGERFAMPQSSLVELVSASDGSGRTIEYIDGVAVLRLRDRLLPLISLQALLGLERADEPPAEACIIVARVGSFSFGVIVDRVFDTEEIVVKPVASILRHIKLYSGATILGDGSVILILDLKGVSVECGAGQGALAGQEGDPAEEAREQGALTDLLVFRVADETLKAAPLTHVSRIEEVAAAQIEWIDGRSVIQYRGRLTPVVGPDGDPVAPWEGGGERPLLVFTRDDRTVGLLVHEIVDIVECALDADIPSARAGALGGLIIHGVATEVIDVDHYWRQAFPDDALAAAAAAQPGLTPSPATEKVDGATAQSRPRRLLLIDDSPFSQLLLRPLLANAGYEVVVAEDPGVAVDLYDAGERFQLILADTSSADGARKLAATLQRATGWHKTPLLSLAVHNTVTPGAAGSTHATLLDAVSGTLDGLRGAA